MGKLQKCMIFALIVPHLIMLYLLTQTSITQTAFFVTVLLVFVADMVLSFWQMETFSATYTNIGDFFVGFCPYFFEKLLLGVIEFLIYFIPYGGDSGHSILSEGFNFAIWFAVCAITMFLTALVTFVTGAARTMLYHDKGKRGN